MSKIIIVERCGACPYKTSFGCKEYLREDGTPDWCPLPDLPERKEEMEYLAVGWNACLDAIMEEI